jgi:hypothetical protein
LTTKDQKTLRENQARTQSGTRFYRNCFFLRCSRPLCSSQPTTPSHPHPAPKGCEERHARETRNNTPRPTRTAGTPHQGEHLQTTQKQGPVISGPNSVPNALVPLRRPPAFQTHQAPEAPPKESTGPGRRTNGNRREKPKLSVDIPPMSTHRGTNARAMGILLEAAHPTQWKHARTPGAP